VHHPTDIWVRPFGFCGSKLPFSISHLITFDHQSANWDCVSVIVKTGGDLRQEQLAVQLIREFQRIWTEENCACWVR